MTSQAVHQAIEALQAGKFVILTDNVDRENEGDLILAAEKVTQESIAFMIRHTGGIICVPMQEDRLEELKLHQMVNENTDRKQTAFTVSIDYRHGTTTGISAADRAATIKALLDPSAKPADFMRPGHIFPLKYKKGGVLKRSGHTEASIDLLVLAGLQPVSVISELMKDTGEMMRMPDLQTFGERYDIPILTIDELIRYRRKKEKLVTCVSQARLPTKYGEFTAYVYRSELDDMEHLALVKGEIAGKDDVLVRVHSECLTGDVFASQRCDCGNQLHMAMEKIASEGNGVIVYLRGHEGRGIGLGHKLRAYSLQDLGKDTYQANIELGFPADSREYGIGAQILADLGVTTLRLLTNNPSKYSGLAAYDLTISDRVPLISEPNEENKKYLKAKKKQGHFFDYELEE